MPESPRSRSPRAAASLWAVPLLFGAWRAASMFLAEKLPVDYPPVSDGFGYMGIARNLLAAGVLDEYRLTRIAPSVVVHFGLRSLGLPLTNANVVLGFDVLNLFALCGAAYAVDRALRRLDVGGRARELGVVLLLVNYPMLKYSVFYPVLTDFAAIGLASLLLLFHLEKRPVGLVVTSFVAAFTWPILFVQGLVLLVLPVEEREHEPLARRQRLLLGGLSAVWGLGLLVYFVVLRGLDTYTGSLRNEPGWVAVSAPFLVAMYFFLPAPLDQRAFFDGRAVRATLRPGRILVALGIVAAFWLTRDALVTRELAPSRFDLAHFLSVQVLYGSVRPLINLVAHTSFYGCLAVLVLIFWKPLAVAVAKRGLGLALAFLLDFYLILLGSESRQLSNLLPWFVVFLCVALDRYRLPPGFNGMILVLNVVLSKVWLPMGDPWFTQRQMMSNGPWMSEGAWLLQLGGFLVAGGLVFFSLFRPRIDGGVAVDRARGLRPRDAASGPSGGRSIPLAAWLGAAVAAQLVFLALRALLASS